MPERFTHEAMAYELLKMVHAKQDWIERFSRGKAKRPDHEVETKRHELSVLQQARTDYAKAAERAA